MAILVTVWTAIRKAGLGIAKAFKWLYKKTHGGIVWLFTGIGSVLLFLLLKSRTGPMGPTKNKPTPSPEIGSGLERVKEQAEALVEKAEQTKQAAEKARTHADEFISQIEERRKKRQGPILPIIAIIMLAALLAAGTVLASESPLLPKPNLSAVTDQALADAYLEQVRIAEEWRQRCLEADEDNGKLIAEIRVLQGQIQNQNAMIDSLTTMIKTLEGIIDELKAWTGQLYSLISTLTKRNVGISTGAVLKFDQQAVKIEGIMVGINW